MNRRDLLKRGVVATGDEPMATERLTSSMADLDDPTPSMTAMLEQTGNAVAITVGVLLVGLDIFLASL